MRLVTAVAALAGFLAAAPSGAVSQSMWTIGTAPPRASAVAGVGPLAPDEILFEVQAIGSSRSVADRSLFSVAYTGRGVDDEAASTAARDLRRRLIEIAAQFGSSPIEVDWPISPGFATGEPLESWEPGMGAQRPSSREPGELTLVLGDPAQIPQLRAALENAGARVAGPFHQLEDDTNARQRARADALARAREDADAFAREQGLQVVRLLRFSEITSDPLLLMRVMSQVGGNGGATPEVETEVSAAVAFALAPR